MNRIPVRAVVSIAVLAILSVAVIAAEAQGNGAAPPPTVESAPLRGNSTLLVRAASLVLGLHGHRDGAPGAGDAALRSH